MLLADRPCPAPPQTAVGLVGIVAAAPHENPAAMPSAFPRVVTRQAGLRRQQRQRRHHRARWATETSGRHGALRPTHRRPPGRRCALSPRGGAADGCCGSRRGRPAAQASACGRAGDRAGLGCRAAIGWAGPDCDPSRAGRGRLLQGPRPSGAQAANALLLLPWTVSRAIGQLTPREDPGLYPPADRRRELSSGGRQAANGAPALPRLTEHLAWQRCW